MKCNLFIKKLDKRIKESLNEEEQTALLQIISELLTNNKLKIMAKLNSIEDFRYVFNRVFLDSVIENFNHDSPFFAKIMDDEKVRNLLKKYLLDEIFKQLKV